MIPEVLTKRYENLRELLTAEELLSTIQASGIDGQEVQFITEKISALNADLDATEAEAKRILDSLPGSGTRVYAVLHYQCGYMWAEIAAVFSKTEDAVKATVYRGLRMLNGNNQEIKRH